MKRVFRIIAFWFRNLFTKKKPVNKNKVVSKKRVMPGLKVWEADLTTGNVIPAEMEVTIAYDVTGKPRKNRKVLLKQNCIYEYALNGENAVRKLELRIKNIIKTAQ